MRTKSFQLIAFVFALLLVSNIQAQNEKAPVKKPSRNQPRQIDAPPPPPTPMPENKVYEQVEEMPRFPGCEDMDLTNEELEKCANRELSMYISKKLKYPADAREKGIQGTVVIQFIVGKDGKLSDPKIVEDIGEGRSTCGMAALDVVKQMQSDIKWKAGKERGRPVNVIYKLPFTFKL